MILLYFKYYLKNNIIKDIVTVSPKYYTLFATSLPASRASHLRDIPRVTSNLDSCDILPGINAGASC